MMKLVLISLNQSKELEDIQFVDCGPTIKEEIKEENVEESDPRLVSHN